MFPPPIFVGDIAPSSFTVAAKIEHIGMQNSITLSKYDIRKNFVKDFRVASAAMVRHYTMICKARANVFEHDILGDPQYTIDFDLTPEAYFDQYHGTLDAYYRSSKDTRLEVVVGAGSVVFNGSNRGPDA